MLAAKSIQSLAMILFYKCDAIYAIYAMYIYAIQCDEVNRNQFAFVFTLDLFSKRFKFSVMTMQFDHFKSGFEFLDIMQC